MTDELRELIVRFNEAVEGMPAEVQTRIDIGQQFNAYEDAGNDEDGEPDWWEYQLCIGPITNRRDIVTVEGENVAKLLEAALKLSTHVAANNIEAQADELTTLRAQLAQAEEALGDIAEADVERADNPGFVNDIARATLASIAPKEGGE